MRVAIGCLTAAVAWAWFAALAAGDATAKRDYTLAIYYWPAYHADPFHEARLGKGWTEWNVVKAAKPLFEGHEQPRVPLWGYRDESDPKQMARSIDAMANAGIDAIIFDWYRYEDGEMLEGALRRGFLNAPNRQRLAFALMWANHTYEDCHPFKAGASFGSAAVWRKGEVSRAAFVRHTNDAIRRYFRQPNYWRVEGKPYFSFFDLQLLIRGLGDLAATRAALDDFQARARAAGFPGVHLNVIDRGLGSALRLVRGQMFPGDRSRKVLSIPDLLAALGVDSATSYSRIPSQRRSKAPPPGADAPKDPAEAAGVTAVEYTAYCQDVLAQVKTRRAGVRVLPLVSAGWDGSPRNYKTPVAVNRSPETYRALLQATRAWLDTQPDQSGILILNAWNEWAEGSYLEPDTRYGTQYLDAIRAVFGTDPP